MILVTCISGQRNNFSAKSSFSRYAVRSNVVYGVAKSNYTNVGDIPFNAMLYEDGSPMINEDGSYILTE